jgi:hypothetical protein
MIRSTCVEVSEDTPHCSFLSGLAPTLRMTAISQCPDFHHALEIRMQAFAEDLYHLLIAWSAHIVAEVELMVKSRTYSGKRRPGH